MLLVGVGAFWGPCCMGVGRAGTVCAPQGPVLPTRLLLWCLSKTSNSSWLSGLSPPGLHPCLGPGHSGMDMPASLSSALCPHGLSHGCLTRNVSLLWPRLFLPAPCTRPSIPSLSMERLSLSSFSHLPAQPGGPNLLSLNPFSLGHSPS